uniref:DEAD/DEAH box helicase n=1 Tax=Rappaport israeli TaxID=1839807 RepID=UPI000A47BF6E|nr:DEAD/DEAH box helicase [Rappaport israeli]
MASSSPPSPPSHNASPPQTHLDRHGIHLSVGDQQPRDTLIQRLINAGYQPTAHINAKGEYATRGAIVDLYPLNASHPIRLEWLDNQIDSIREFNLDDQTTHQKHQSLSLLPTSELDLTQTGRTCFRQSARQQLGENIIHSPLYQRISDGQTLQGLEYYLPLFFDDTASLFDYLPPNTHLISPTDPQPALEKHHNYCQKRYQRLNALRQNQLLAPEALWFSPNVIQTHLNTLPAQPYHPSADNIDFSGDEYDRKQQWLKQIHHPSKPLFLHFTSQGNREHWLEKLQKQKLNPQLLDITPPFEEQSPAQLTLIQSPLQYSFHSPHATHLAEADLHAGHQTPNFHQSKNPHAGAQIESLQTLSLGAPIVHIDHGVGRYQGLTRLSPESDELMRIEYAKGSTLYVPITDLDLITRYSGANPETAPLHELGGKQWQTSKRKIQQSIRDTASELLEIYAQRENAQGIAIDYDPQDLQQFADNFPYEETPDQTQAIQTVLSDLRSERPMDRIICGDVGFGKTEVAVRAAYASVLGGQQVALIAPTTLLANQHYHHFLDRFADYSLTINLVSRFKSTAEQKASLEKLKNGQLDLIIGTHRLLQKDVQFANLGLVIIDEEQRFGVRHKERLKSLRANVNLLTLTATPIPRTLTSPSQDYATSPSSPPHPADANPYKPSSANGI